MNIPRWGVFLGGGLLVLSLGVNLALIQRVQVLSQQAGRTPSGTALCFDGERKGYSRGALIAVDGQIKRCGENGSWSDSDQVGRPLGAAPAGAPQTKL